MPPLPWGGPLCALLLVGSLPALAAERPVDGQDIVEPAPLTPDDVVTAALANDVPLHAAEADAVAARGRIAQSSTLLDNPEFEARVAPLGGGFEVAASQDLSSVGEASAGRREGRASLAAAAARLTRARLVAAAGARDAYAEASAATELAIVAEEGWTLATRLRGAVESKLAAGESSRLDVHLARMREAQAAAVLLEVREREASAQTELATRMGRVPGDRRLLRDPLAAAPEPSRVDAGEVERSDVLGTRAAVAAAEARIALEAGRAVPGIALGIFVERDAGSTTVGPTLSFALPLFDRNQAGRAEARGGRDIARAEAGVAAVRAEAERSLTRRRLDGASEVSHALGDGIRGDARDALASISSGYAAGELDLLDTVLLQAEVLEGEAAAIEVRLALARARLDFLLATDDPALLSGDAR